MDRLNSPRVIRPSPNQVPPSRMLPRPNWKRPWEDVDGHSWQPAEASPQIQGTSENNPCLGNAQSSVDCHKRSMPVPGASSCSVSFMTNSQCAPALPPTEPERLTPFMPHTHPHKRPKIQESGAVRSASRSVDWTTTKPRASPESAVGVMRRDVVHGVEHEDGARQMLYAQRSPDGHQSGWDRSSCRECRWCGSCRSLLQTIVSELSHVEVGQRYGTTRVQSGYSSMQTSDDVHQQLGWILDAVRKEVSPVRDRIKDGCQGNPLGSVPCTGQTGAQWIGSAQHADVDTSRRFGVDKTGQQECQRESATDESSISPHSVPRNIGQLSGSANAKSPFQGGTSSSYLHPRSSFEREQPPTGQPSLHTSLTAGEAHFRDLQHQVSTKTLALQSLQQEHDHLLSAYSRSRTRCAALEKKFQVSDVEINKLTEERLSLQAQVDTLEAQVEELTKARDDARAQSVANGGQYIQIMSMASRLEAQNAADKKKWKAEREAWEETEDELRRHIAQLERTKEQALRLAAPDLSPPPGLELAAASAHIKTKSPFMLPEPAQADEVKGHSTAPADSNTLAQTSNDVKPGLDDALGDELDAILASGSVDDLRVEVARLRGLCRGMETALQDVKSEGYRVDQLLQKFGAIGKRIIVKADVASRRNETC